MSLEPHLQRLLTTEGFIDSFWSMCIDYKTQEQAYEAVERLYERTFGKRRYSGFDSFRTIRDRFIKQKQG